ncbi:MAG TPA: glutathione-disulfide reductase [Quisquiliibacterium sp.]|nr:glutathione-disulfide reductase [Quisquiliibacterium sp.]
MTSPLPDAVDLFVIGAGSGGVRAARIAAAHGARVAVAEAFRVGGTCVIRGCVPKKLLVLASRFADDFALAPSFGWTLDGARFDWATLRDAKEREITRLEGVYARNLAASGVSLMRGRAGLAGPGRVALDDGRVVQASRILIATGGRPFRPDVPGAELAVTSNEMFDLPALPASILIVGGGYIAVEFACLLQRLGVRVTLAYRGERILRGFDHDLRAHLSEEMARAGIDVRTRCDLQAIARDGDGYVARLSDGAHLGCGLVMLATGRVPNVEGLGLEAAGVAVDAAGAIRVTDDSRTTAAGIWAIGDVTNRIALTPVAIREGHAFADTEFGGRPWTCDHTNVPSAVFATPEIGTVGMTEEDARARVGAVDIYRTSFRPMKVTLSDIPERMLMKLVVDATTDRVLGVHVAGPDAAEIIQMAGIAVKMGATKRQFDDTVAVHPSAAEELVTMRTKAA